MNSFQVILSKIDNKSRVFDLNLNMTIKDFKDYIYNSYNLQPAYYFMIHQAKILDNGMYKTFKDFNESIDNTQLHIKKDSIIHITIRGVTRK
tara:strand:- start:565 stop:840 length:276 start_codon:yes stop_codon:yes gene_type:complete